MSSLAFPLRMEKGLLRRCSESEALASLLEVIGRTDHGSWSGSEAFGTFGLTKAGATRQQARQIQDALNQSLRDLHITAYRVASVEPERSPTPDSQTFVVVFEATEATAQPITLRLGK